MVSLSKTIFKAYDIRGIINQILDAGIAEQIGRAFGRAARAQGEAGAAIGRDGRLSGPELAVALARIKDRFRRVIPAAKPGAEPPF